MEMLGTVYNVLRLSPAEMRGLMSLSGRRQESRQGTKPVEKNMHSVPDGKCNISCYSVIKWTNDHGYAQNRILVQCLLHTALLFYSMQDLVCYIVKSEIISIICKILCKNFFTFDRLLWIRYVWSGILEYCMLCSVNNMQNIMLQVMINVSSMLHIQFVLFVGILF